jgi:hypothetical protein
METTANPGLEALLLHPGLICDAPSGLNASTDLAIVYLLLENEKYWLRLNPFVDLVLLIFPTAMNRE